MQISIIAGSHAADSQSARVARYVSQRLQDLSLSIPERTRVQDLGASPLPLWDMSGSGLDPELAAHFAGSEAFILISPDWHGMATPAIKNWFYYLQPQWMEHKPVLLVGVSSGQGGLYPILDLRANSFKNFRPCYLPEHLVIRDVKSQLPEQGGAVQPMGERIDYCLQLLAVYAQGLGQVRASLPVRAPAFAFGM